MAKKPAASAIILTSANLAALVEINEGATDDNGNVAVRATAEGISHSADNGTTETASAPAVKSSFNVMDVPDEWLGFSGDYDWR